MAEQSIAERLRRKPEQYAGASPKAIAGGSTAQMMYFVEDANADIATLLAGIERLTKERDEAREVLGWYATQVELCRKITREGDIARADLDRDGGRRARATLNKDTANG